MNNNTNRNIRDKLRYSDDELLYNYNSTTILYESIELLETLRNKIKKQNSKHVERQNGMLIFDLVVKYCIYAETLGATINGYQKLDKSKIDKTISNIFHLLVEIAGVYVSFVKSYNAYKHGHRVWYGYDLNAQKSNSFSYIEREYKPNNYVMNYVPLDNGIVTDYIFPHSNDCRRLL